LDNVLIAGRMMSVDLVAHNSTRNTVCCLICGQAAGAASAIAASEGIGPLSLDIGKLRHHLKNAGALLSPKLDPLRVDKGKGFSR
jgi:hypothetical protein